MSAPAGNEFWKLRSKHGRDKIFETPETMWEAACEYFNWCDQNPLLEHDFVGKDAEPVHRKKMRAYTLSGLCLYLDVNTVYFNHFETALNSKESAINQGFSKVITRIRDVIYTQKFTGAAAGMLNHNIIARDLGLTDKKELDVSGVKQVMIIGDQEIEL